jgi:hypothetical protein
LTWSDTSSKSARPAKDFESCETVSIAESAQCPLVQRLAQHLNHEWMKGISDIEGKAARVAASEWSRRAAGDIDGKTERSNVRACMSQSGRRTSFNQHSRGNGISETEGKGAKGSVERRGSGTSFKLTRMVLLWRRSACRSQNDFKSVPS